MQFGGQMKSLVDLLDKCSILSVEQFDGQVYNKLKGARSIMKHEVTTLNTKKTLAASLKRFMEKKPLSKITVSEIITDCGVNRKTFYYHFEDIYALLKWMLEEEAVDVVKQFNLLVDYREAVLFVLNYVKTNKHLLCCAYDSMGRDKMKRFFFIPISSALHEEQSSMLSNNSVSMSKNSSRNSLLIFTPKQSPEC